MKASAAGERSTVTATADMRKHPAAKSSPPPGGAAKPAATAARPKPGSAALRSPATHAGAAGVSAQTPATPPSRPPATPQKPDHHTAGMQPPAGSFAPDSGATPGTPPSEPRNQDVKIQDVKTADAKPADSRPMNASPGQRPVMHARPAAKEESFVEGDFVVYPTHGVGRVEKIAIEDIAGHRLELIHITFEENRMTLRVPVAKARTAGLRKLATQAKFDEALTVLKGRARIKRTMWSRRAQEYEAKINSGDPIAIAEVVRDLHRNAGQPDQSFSERQIYESAMDRLAAELAALDRSDKLTATTKLVNFLKTV
jgi:CarD family transcriptional regulator